MLTAALRGGAGQPGLHEEWREFRYRSLFHLTHAEYLDEPAVTVDWMLGVDGAFRRAQEDANSSRPTGPDANGVVTRDL